jgi:hypothetical protein
MELFEYVKQLLHSQLSYSTDEKLLEKKFLIGTIVLLQSNVILN